MTEILKDRIERKSSPWHYDSRLKEIENELKMKFQHFGYLFKIQKPCIENDELKVSLLIKYPFATTISQYFENKKWSEFIFVPIGYAQNIETFFVLDREAHNLFLKFRNLGWIK